MTEVVKLIDVHLDFETFSNLDIKKVGAWAYSEHDSTEVLCTAYAYEEEDPILIPGNLSPIPDFLLKENWGKFRIHAHNSFFEYCIILNTLGIEPPPLEYWVDTAAAAAAMSLPRALGDLCRVLGLPSDKAKDKRGKALISKLCSPQVSRKKATKGKLTRNSDSALLQELYDYCKQDVVAERASSKLIFPLSAAEQKIWVVDQKINVRGVNVDKEMVEHCIYIYENQMKALTKELKELTGLDNPNSQPQFFKWAKERGYTEDNLQADTIRDFLETMDDSDPEFKKAIQLKVSLGRTAPKKFYALLRRLGKDGKIHGNFMYHGASTGRWASLGINLQNLLRPKMKDVNFIFECLPKRDHKLLEFLWGDTVEALASCIRGMLIPSPGCRFIICDYSQIEARIIAWLAGEIDTLDIFRQGKDIYIHAASQIFQIPFEKVTEEQRFSGKTAILACGFQGGWSALQKMAKNYGVELEDDFCNMIVKKWRKENPRIVQYWKATEDAAVHAIRKPGEIFTVSDFMDDPDIKLPSIKYRVARRFSFLSTPFRPRLTFIRSTKSGDKENNSVHHRRRVPEKCCF